MKNDYNIETSDTENTEKDNRSMDLSGDIIMRIYKGEVVHQWETVDLRDAISKYFHELLSVSREAISPLKKHLDYNGFYIAHLLNQLSDEDFRRICEEYSVSLSREEAADLYQKVKLLFGISNELFTPSDLSNIFKIEPHIAENILERLREEGLISYSNSDEDETF